MSVVKAWRAGVTTTDIRPIGESMSEVKPPDPGQAIQKANPAAAVQMTRGGVMLQSLDDLLKFAKMCTENGAAPKGMNHQQAAVAIQAGLERGMGIMASLQAGVVINGVLSWRGWAVVGLIQNASVTVPGTFKSWVDGVGDERTGYCKVQRRGYAEPFLRAFSVRDAKVAKLWTKGGPWDTRPDNMLEWRAIGEMGRFHFGDVLGGIPIAEDVEAGYGPGPSEPSRELPAEQRPSPPSPVRDPILAELAAGAQAQPAPAAAPETIEIEATLVPEPSMTPDGLQTVPAPVAGFPAVTPEQRAIIDKQVDEVFASPKTIEPGGPCPRCTATRNAMNGCDVCGWPGADNGERP